MFHNSVENNAIKHKLHDEAQDLWHKCLGLRAFCKIFKKDTRSQLCRGNYKTVASLHLSGRAPCKGGPFFSALGAIHSHKVQHSLVTWGRLKKKFYYSLDS